MCFFAKLRQLENRQYSYQQYCMYISRQNSQVLYIYHIAKRSRYSPIFGRLFDTMYVHLAGGRVEGALFNTLFTSRQLVRNVEKQFQVGSPDTTINRILLYGNQDKLNSRTELCTFTCTCENCVHGVMASYDAQCG
jgi:hypothetical protein